MFGIINNVLAFGQSKGLRVVKGSLLHGGATATATGINAMHCIPSLKEKKGLVQSLHAFFTRKAYPRNGLVGAQR